MPKLKKKKNGSEKKEKYNSENEIIIGVTTKLPKRRVEKKDATRSKAKKMNSEKSFKIKKKNTLKSNKTKIIASFFILFILSVGTIAFILTTPTFNITNIIVNGNEKNDTDTYINLTQIKIGETNIYQITKNQIKKRLMQNTYVESAEIQRKLPNTIEINIKERKACFQILSNEKYAYIDNQGYILEYSDIKLKVPVLIGLESLKNEIKEGQRLLESDLYKINTTLKILNYLNNNNISNEVSSIDLTDTSNYTINMDKDNKIIYLGDASNISERMNLLKTILEREKGKKGKIFMNGDPNKSDVYFREE